MLDIYVWGVGLYGGMPGQIQTALQEEYDRGRGDVPSGMGFSDRLRNDVMSLASELPDPLTIAQVQDWVRQVGLPIAPRHGRWRNESGRSICIWAEENDTALDAPCLWHAWKINSIQGCQVSLRSQSSIWAQPDSRNPSRATQEACDQVTNRLHTTAVVELPYEPRSFLGVIHFLHKQGAVHIESGYHNDDKLYIGTVVNWMTPEEYEERRQRLLQLLVE